MNCLIVEKGSVTGYRTPSGDVMFDRPVASELFKTEDIIKAFRSNNISSIERSLKGVRGVKFEDSGNKEREFTPENITSLKPNEIFVFGSNTEGKHGKGAALIAKNNFRAIYGQAEGLQGQSYAIITKDLTKGERSIPLNLKTGINIRGGITIGLGIENFLRFAIDNPKLKFYVTKIGSSLAGYTTNEIKNLFVNSLHLVPDNVILPKEYEFRKSFNKNNENQQVQETIENTDITHFDILNSIIEFTPDYNGSVAGSSSIIDFVMNKLQSNPLYENANEVELEKLSEYVLSSIASITDHLDLKNGIKLEEETIDGVIYTKINSKNDIKNDKNKIANAIKNYKQTQNESSEENWMPFSKARNSDKPFSSNISQKPTNIDSLKSILSDYGISYDSFSPQLKSQIETKLTNNPELIDDLNFIKSLTCL